MQGAKKRKLCHKEESKQANKFYMVITVGMIDIGDKIKEALTNTRVHPETGESLPAGGLLLILIYHSS